MITYQNVLDKLNEVKEIQHLNFSDLQTFKSMINWEIGDSKNINGSISTLVMKNKNHIRFLTEIPPSVIFPLHWHDCLEECTVLSGEMVSLKNNGEKWEKGDVAKFPPYTKHHLKNKASKSCFLQVDFYK